MYIMFPKPTVAFKINYLFVKVFVCFSSAQQIPVLHQVESSQQAVKPN